MTNNPDTIKAAFVFRSGADCGEVVRGYRSALFRAALASAGIEAVTINVAADGQAGAATTRPGQNALTCFERDLPELLRGCTPHIVQTFGVESALGPVWNAASRIACPILHFVQSRTPAAPRARGAIARALACLTPQGHGIGARHVTGVLGSNRAIIARFMDAGAFPRAQFSRVIAPPIELVDTASAPSSTAKRNFGVHDRYGTEDTVRFLLQAITLAGHPDLFNLTLACPAFQVPSVIPSNVSAIAPKAPEELLDTVDVLILPYDADHLIEGLLMALRAGKIVLVPDGGVASELIRFGKDGVLFAAGNAYDLALKMNLVTRSGGNVPFEFQGGEETVRKCAPSEVANAFAGAFRLALTSTARA